MRQRMCFALVVATVALAGCGRLGFDDVGNGSGEPDAALPTGRWAKVASAGYSSCAITTGGELWCWGQGFEGQLGTGGSPAIASLARVGSASDWTTVDAETNHACALRGAGELYCWGNNSRGAIGTGPVGEIALVPVAIGAARWIAVSLGHEMTCALRDDGTLWCWGRNDFNQLGDGTRDDRPQPQQIGTATYKQLEVGGDHGCAIRSDDTLWCWGANDFGQVGSGDFEQQATAVAIAPTKRWRALAAGFDHTCALDLDGRAWCWGANYDGRLGLGTTNTVPEPVVVQSPALAQIAVGDAHSCGATAAGELLCWGTAAHGEVPGYPARYVTTPAQIRGAPPVTALFAGAAQTCVIDDAARLWCSGRNGMGQTGAPAGEQHGLTRADGRTDWAMITADRSHGCGATTTEITLCWGLGSSGQVGDSEYQDRQGPVRVSPAFDALTSSRETTLALRDGALWGWGYDVFGQGYVGEPAVLASGIVGAAVGDGHQCRLASGGALTCAGENYAGQVGNGTFDRVLPPGAVVAGSWRAVFAGRDATCATRTDGAVDDRLYCWGRKVLVGSPAAADVATPTAAVLSRGVQHVAFGANFGCARADGEAWCWGVNYAGQLGDGSNTDSAAPVRVAVPGDIVDVDAGDEHACAVTADGALWCWGHADQGQLLEPLTGQRMQPTQLPGGGWRDVACGDHFTCAIKADGTRWCFGTNNEGELGDDRAWITDLTVVP